MSRHPFIISFILSAAMLAGCSQHAQLTSGANYLSRYPTTPAATTSSIDMEIRDIAAIEPDLYFPARIGLARIQDGRLISIPGDEAEDWAEMTNELGGGFGEVIPVSPLIAAMVNPPTMREMPARSVVNQIRRGAARQHLDYVLIYEVTDLSGSEKNALSLADLSILGLFMLPSRDVEVKASATAMMIDVRNGYPYGTASAFAEKDALATAYGTRDKKRKLADKGAAARCG